MARLPVIDQSKCDCCGLCVSACVRGALKIEDDVIKVVQVENDEWCTTCELVCPTGAITCPFDVVEEDETK